MTVDLAQLDSLRCHGPGAVALGGRLLGHFQRLDALFASWALQEGGESYRFPDLVPISMMDRVGYLASFPQLATFVASLPRDESRLRAFAARAHRDPGFDPALLASPTSMLAPAACYHAYAQLQDADLAAPHIAT